MTAKTTRIYVDLTDEQMDKASPRYPSLAIAGLVYDAIKAQRPRPIAVGDRVNVDSYGAGFIYEVKAAEGGYAWLWLDGEPVPWAVPVSALTRVDDEATP